MITQENEEDEYHSAIEGTYEQYDSSQDDPAQDPSVNQYSQGN